MAEAPLEEPRGRRLLESVAAAGMELCWLYAAVSCLLRLGGLPPWPLRDALLPFLAAALPSAWGRGRGWRVWQLAALHLAAFLAAAAPVWARSRAEWARIASGAAAPGEWVAPLWGLVVLAAFWWSGLATARRSPSGRAVAARFDIGACVLAAVVLLGLLTRRPTPAVGSLLPAYFLFGLLAVSLARSRGTGTRSRPAGARATGLVFSVGLAAAVLGSALLFLLPLIQAAARVGYTVLRSAAVSLSPCCWPSCASSCAFFPCIRRRSRPPAPPGRTASCAPRRSWPESPVS